MAQGATPPHTCAAGALLAACWCTACAEGAGGARTSFPYSSPRLPARPVREGVGPRTLAWGSLTGLGTPVAGPIERERGGALRCPLEGACLPCRAASRGVRTGP